MEYWNIGSVLRGLKNLGDWQDVTVFYVLACKIFTKFPFNVKKVATTSIDVLLTIIPSFRYSIIPRRRHKTITVQSKNYDAPYAASAVNRGVSV